MSQILDKLFLGQKNDVTTKGFLVKHGITHIFNCAWEAAYAVPNDIKYFEMKLKDQQDFPMMDYLDKAADHINKILTEENGTIFIHCMWGVSRSATLVIAYLIKYQKWSCCEAKEFVKKRRPVISPNPGFWTILQDYCARLNPSLLGEKHSHERLEATLPVKKINAPKSFKAYREENKKDLHKGANKDGLRQKDPTFKVLVYEKGKKQEDDQIVGKIKIEEADELEVGFRNNMNLKENPIKEEVISGINQDTVS